MRLSFSTKHKQSPKGVWKKGVCRIFIKEKHISVFLFNKVAGCRPTTLSKKDSDTCVFL